MKRSDLIRLETHIRLLVKKYQTLSHENNSLKSQLLQLESEKNKKQNLIIDLKEQLNSLSKVKSEKMNTKDLKELQAKVLQLIEDIDQCIKAIQ